MLSSFPSLTKDEFRDGCQALQKRCDGRLNGTDWLDIRWQQEALTIKKAYHVDSSKRLDDDTRTPDSEYWVTSLQEADSEDEVWFLPFCFTRR